VNNIYVSPIAVENVSSYAEFHMSEMTEWEFLNEVVERAGRDAVEILVRIEIVVSRPRGSDSHRRPLEISEIHP
jgi:uncharacterized protein (UPF0276 family)